MFGDDNERHLCVGDWDFIYFLGITTQSDCIYNICPVEILVDITPQYNVLVAHDVGGYLSNKKILNRYPCQIYIHVAPIGEINDTEIIYFMNKKLDFLSKGMRCPDQ